MQPPPQYSTSTQSPIGIQHPPLSPGAGAAHRDDVLSAWAPAIPLLPDASPSLLNSCLAPAGHLEIVFRAASGN
eukprot:CAMPEP_0202861032 /NCGR_PEP_ID=MMETSP1391-20130828/2567_1 /ASSEMBLY_ACC=CAM_ASM_000867 /TAXON_ID=1034604 /ORGANISM="Chlamydomonas leiostraca, Strain SAG 11-49" /LENGTH=73 /DNA_ID=CAMNT_0049540351 /DNA_START=523 /DNA_END=745 /DNA_ORIENTATION=-